jgi:hypothetical protein
MKEIVVEGLDYEDFVFVKEILKKSSFTVDEEKNYINNKVVIEKIDQVLKAFD